MFLLMFQWTLAKASPEVDSQPCPCSWLAELHTGLEITLSAANLSLQTSNREYHMLSARFPGIYTCGKTTCLCKKNKKQPLPPPKKNTQIFTCIWNKNLSKYSYVGGGKFWLPVSP